MKTPALSASPSSFPPPHSRTLAVAPVAASAGDTLPGQTPAGAAHPDERQRRREQARRLAAALCRLGARALLLSHAAPLPAPAPRNESAAGIDERV